MSKKNKPVENKLITKKIECDSCESVYKLSYHEDDINEDGSLTCVFCGSNLNNNKKDNDIDEDNSSWRFNEDDVDDLEIIDLSEDD